MDVSPGRVRVMLVADTAVQFPHRVAGAGARRTDPRTTKEDRLMTKVELINAVAERTQLTKKDAAAVVDAVFDEIAAALSRGDRVQVVGFGTFEVRQRAARRGRNPQTGQELSIAARRTPAFKAGKMLKEAVLV